MSTFPKLFSIADDPLSLFVRAGRQDHLVISQWLSESRTGISGVVFDPCCEDAQNSLRHAAHQSGLWCILDPKALELSTPAGATAKRLGLPWGGASEHSLAHFDAGGTESLAEQVAAFVATHAYTAVLAPTHFLTDGAADRWFGIDRAIVQKLRLALDRLGKSRVQIFYPLAVPMAVFRNPTQIAAFVDVLRDQPISAIWLRVSPFGSDSGHVTLQNYLNACRLLQNAGLPIMAEKAGAIGLALLAFGAVSGVEAGVATGEKFDIQRLRRIAKPGRFPIPPRVYIQRLNSFLTRKQAEEFFAVRGMKEFACLDGTCCRRGVADMLEHNKRHFLNSRANEVGLLSEAPVGMRPSHYLDEILRPATDQLGRIARYSGVPADILKKLDRDKRKLDGWRATLSSLKRFHVRVAEPKALPRQISLFQTDFSKMSNNITVS